MSLVCRTAAKSRLVCSPVSLVQFTDQPRVLQVFSVAVSPQAERYVGWLIVPVPTGASILRSALSTVASLNASSHGSQVMTQAVP